MLIFVEVAPQEGKREQDLGLKTFVLGARSGHDGIKTPAGRTVCA